ncbi:MAG: hydroxymethylglutaryl-CoA reductase, degradative, partial [Chloroflexota bacterium]|nr:hydroxymethylglutaryl-CoA reductase, degradative [Chloroflexota bacterium]
MDKPSPWSGFYKLSLEKRIQAIAEWAALSAEETEALHRGLSLAQGERMIENAVGTYALPLGIAVHFLINGRDYLVPMAIEEPSVVAGASYAAKLARQGGGFAAESTEPIMIGQVQVLDIPDLAQASRAISEAEEEILELADAQHPTIVRLGGGAKGLEVRELPDTPTGPMLVIHLLYDTRDAMGANAVNTACEAIAPLIERLTGGRVVLRILSNLADRRLARARCAVPASALGGEEVARGIVEAWALAAVDPYRAATHNKGIMNGIDAVALATGNDWRAIEAGAHAYAARSGHYGPLTTWRQDADGNLVGSIELPMAVGIVGGATKVHPTARVALKILKVKTARELAEVMAAVGLAQNLAALKALATEGIQRGHM